MWNMCFNQEEIKVKQVNMKVEYDSIPIRHIAVQCPDCGNWFFGTDIIQGDCQYEYQLHRAKCHCPKCGSDFRVGHESNIEESNEFPEFYDKCLKQKIIWE